MAASSPSGLGTAAAGALGFGRQISPRTRSALLTSSSREGSSSAIPSEAAASFRYSSQVQRRRISCLHSFVSPGWFRTASGAEKIAAGLTRARSRSGPFVPGAVRSPRLWPSEGRGRQSNGRPKACLPHRAQNRGVRSWPAERVQARPRRRSPAPGAPHKRRPGLARRRSAEPQSPGCRCPPSSP